VICNLETEPKTHKGTEYAVFKKTIPDPLLLSLSPFVAILHVNNVWSRHECLTRRSETAEAKLIKPRLDIARCDIKVRPSCF